MSKCFEHEYVEKRYINALHYYYFMYIKHMLHNKGIQFCPVQRIMSSKLLGKQSHRSSIDREVSPQRRYHPPVFLLMCQRSQDKIFTQVSVRMIYFTSLEMDIIYLAFNKKTADMRRRLSYGSYSFFTDEISIQIYHYNMKWVSWIDPDPELVYST